MIQVNRKQLAIKLQKDANLPKMVTTDSGRLQQVLLNLLTNAITHTETGTITLRAALDAHDVSTLIFQVSDTGTGMTREKQVQLFKLLGGEAALARRGLKDGESNGAIEV